MLQFCRCMRYGRPGCSDQKGPSSLRMGVPLRYLTHSNLLRHRARIQIQVLEQLLTQRGSLGYFKGGQPAASLHGQRVYPQVSVRLCAPACRSPCTGCCSKTALTSFTSSSFNVTFTDARFSKTLDFLEEPGIVMM